MTRTLIPLHKRVALLIRSRSKGLGVAALLMCVMALLALRANDVFFWFTGALISYVAIPLSLAASHEELIGAEVGLWLQKPVREVHFVLMRFVETLATTVGLSLFIGGVCVGLAFVAGWDPEGPVLLSAPAGALASFTMAAMAFGVAAWVPRGSRVVSGVGRFVFFPAPEIVRLGLGLIGDLPFRARNLAVPLAYAIGWITVGTLGVMHSSTRGRIGYDQGR